MAGAFGGDRQAVTDALTNEAALRTTATSDANLRNSGYQSSVNSALQQANQVGGFNVSGNQQLQSLINQRQLGNQQDISNLSAQGATQQQTNQNQLGWQSQRLGILNGILTGYSPQASNFQGAAANLAPNGFASAVQGAQYGAQVGNGIMNYFNQPSTAQNQAQVDQFIQSNPIQAAPSNPFGSGQ